MVRFSNRKKMTSYFKETHELIIKVNFLANIMVCCSNYPTDMFKFRANIMVC